MKQIQLHKNFWRVRMFQCVLFFATLFSTIYSFAQPVTDAKDYKHWANTLGQWINGDLNKHNSSYKEGDVVPHAYIAPAAGLSVGATYTVTFTYNYYWQSSNSGGFTEVLDYDATIPAADIADLSGTPVLSAGHFSTVNAVITSYSATSQSPAGNGLDHSVTVVFNYTGGGDAEIYFGLRLAKPGDVPTPPGTGITKGAGSWPGSSLQTFKNDVDASGNNGAKTLSINPNAFTFDCTFTPEAITGNGTVCVGSTTQLSDATAGGLWASDDETIATVDVNGLVTGVAAGSTNITYTATDENGCGGAVTFTVTVTPKTTPTFDPIPAICEGSTFTLPTSSKENIEGTWSPAIDNTQTTEYTFTPNEGLCATTATLTVTVNKKTVPTFDPIPAICAGGSFTLPSTSKEGIAGSWSPAINNNKTTEYTFTPNTGLCATTAKLTVIVNPKPDCTISSSCAKPVIGQSSTFSVAQGNYTYSWTIKNGTTVVATGTAYSITYAFTTPGTYTVSVTVTDKSTNCSSTCTADPITISPLTSITYTQGFYGNSGGKACGGQYSYQIMLAAVNAAGGSIRFGNPTDGRSFTLKTTDVNNSAKSPIYQMLPGGTTPAVLKLVSGYNTASFDTKASWPIVPMTPSIGNILLAQTMTLRFNLYFSNAAGKPIGGLKIYGNVLKFAKPTASCGSTYSTTTTTQTIPCTVWTAWKGMSGGTTIDNLYLLANNVLGGITTTVTPSDMNNAVDIINKGLDGGAQIVGVSFSSCASAKPVITQNADLQVTELSIAAYPNPYTDRVQFNISSPVSGNASLDVYNMLGQKVVNLYKGYLPAGRGKMVDYKVPAAVTGALIYTLRVGNKQVNGKLIQVK